MPMERKNKIRTALYNEYKAGALISYSEIVKCVQKHYPEIPKDSILPSDFCCNHKNKDPFSGKYHIFEKVGRGSYKLL